jgi:hypothetical protein
MRRFVRPLTHRIGSIVAAALITAAIVLATHGPEAETTVGSNDLVFPQNKQNEPTVAVNPINPLYVAAGANDEIDLEACNVGPDNTCPFTDGVGLTGFQASLDGGLNWVQPNYTGWTARHCLGTAGTSTDTCASAIGPIGTVPWYFEEGLVSDGDPVQTWGPRPGADGTFSWANGARLYYQDLTSNFSSQRDEERFRGFEAIAVSRTDNFAAAADGVKAAWTRPVIISSRLSAVTFSDKNWIAADDAASSPFFGNVYACWVSFRSIGGAPEPVTFSRSTDGGDTWSAPKQLSPAANTGLGHGRQGCQVDTNSAGVVYVFWRGGELGRPVNPPFRPRTILMARSFDGGVSFERARAVADVQECGLFEPVSGRLTFDGIAGARAASFPSVSIANGAPLGNGPDTLYLSWCDGPTPTSATDAEEQAMVQWSTDSGVTWNGPVNAALPNDRPDFPAIAVSPDGTDLYLTYMAFHDPWQTTTAAPRMFEGVVLHASVNPVTGAPGAFAQAHRGVPGDAKSSSANGLTAEFLGDYNAVSATNDFAVAAWNDSREGTACAAIDVFRQAFFAFGTGAGPQPTAPAPQVDCPATFGNSDIWSTRVNDPTP